MSTVKELYRRAVDLVRREPVRALGYAAALGVLAVSYLTDTPVAVVLAELAGAVAAVERVRRMVAPLVKVVIHEDQL